MAVNWIYIHHLCVKLFKHGLVIEWSWCCTNEISRWTFPTPFILRLMVLLWPPHLGLILFVKLLMNVIRTTSRTITCAIHRVTVVRVTCHVTCNQRIASNYSTSCCSFQDYSLLDRTTFALDSTSCDFTIPDGKGN